MDKREFIKKLGSGLLLTSLYSPAEAILTTGSSAKSKLNILMLGGRGFLGPAIVETLINAGHKVTLLNRGLTNPHLFPALPFIQCDREKENKAGLTEVKDQLQAQKWDCVIDTWQKSPKAVADFIEEFGSKIGHYHYISSFAVYDSWDKKGISENEKLNALPEFPGTISHEYRYALRKTFAEVFIMNTSGVDWTIYRCHGIRSNRLPDPDNPHEEPYWPIRFLQGGDILLPDVEGHRIQMTDARSLCNFIVHCSENNVKGKFNVAYPSITFKEYISVLANIGRSPRKLHWIPGKFLIDHGVLPYKEIEYWTLTPGAYFFSVEKAIASGLKNRPIANMLSDQIEGVMQRHPNLDFQFGGTYDGAVVKLSPEKEKSVIEKWINR